MIQREFDDIVKATCPHCAAGNVPRQRDDTKEFVHDFVQPLSGGTFPSARRGHSICMATHFRNAKMGEVIGG